MSNMTGAEVNRRSTRQRHEPLSDDDWQAIQAATKVIKNKAQEIVSVFQEEGVQAGAEYLKEELRVAGLVKEEEDDDK